jgi:hypothetical protein
VIGVLKEKEWSLGTVGPQEGSVNLSQQLGLFKIFSAEIFFNKINAIFSFMF